MWFCAHIDGMYVTFVNRIEALQNVSKHDECCNNHAHARTTLGVQSTARYAQHVQEPSVLKHVCQGLV